MTVHHMIREKDQRHSCPYCGNDTEVPRWKSKFDNNMHYKELVCRCGHKVSIKMRYMSCGDDHWNKDLDKRIEEVDAKSKKE